MIYRPDIALDIDGVLANFGKGAARWARELHLDLGVRAERWYMQTEFMRPSKDWDKFWRIVKTNETFWLSLDRFHDDDHLSFEPGCYITARDSSLEACTKTWLWLKAFPEAQVWCVDTWQAKIEKLNQLGIHILVDDRPDAFEAYHEAGLDCHLMDRPWNQHISTPHRIYSVNEVLK